MTRDRHLFSLHAVPPVAVALATVLFTMWLAATGLKQHSLFADRPAAISHRS